MRRRQVLIQPVTPGPLAAINCSVVAQPVQSWLLGRKQRCSISRMHYALLPLIKRRERCLTNEEAALRG